MGFARPGIGLAAPVVVCLALALTGAAVAEEQIPVVERVSTLSSSWAAYRVSVPEGGDWALNISGGPHDARAWGAGMWWQPVGADWWSWVMITGWGASESRAHVSTAPTGTVVERGNPRVSEDDYNIGFASSGGSGGEFMLVAAVAGEYAGDFVLRGGEGVQILGRSVGTGSAVFLDEEFRGAASVHVGVSVPVLWQHVHAPAGAMVGSSIRTAVSQRLFGWFRPGVGVARRAGPEGADLESGFLIAEPQGTYDFTVDAAVSDSHQTLWFADVALPSGDRAG